MYINTSFDIGIQYSDVEVYADPKPVLPRVRFLLTISQNGKNPPSKESALFRNGMFFVRVCSLECPISLKTSSFFYPIEKIGVFTIDS